MTMITLVPPIYREVAKNSSIHFDNFWLDSGIASSSEKHSVFGTKTHFVLDLNINPHLWTRILYWHSLKIWLRYDDVDDLDDVE